MEIGVSQLLSLIQLVAKPNVDCTWLVFNSTYQYYDFLKISIYQVGTVSESEPSFKTRH